MSGVLCNMVSNYNVAPGGFVPTASTKIWYRLEGDATDSSGSGNNGTANNLTYAAGKVGDGGVFNGTNGSISTSYSGLNTGDMTLSAWVRFDNNSSYQHIFGGDQTTSGGLAYFNGGPYVFLIISGNNVANGGSFTPTVGQWYNFTITRTGTSYIIYKDGVSYFTHTEAGWGTGNFTPGIMNSALPMNGMLDEIIAEDRCWTPTEVLAYYNMTA